MYNQISKGGTNRFHGALYEYFQNEALNALPYAFSGPTSKYFRYNNFGGSVGGPILKRQALLLLQLRSDHFTRKPRAPSSFTVPTAAVLAGDFTGFPTIYDPATQTTQQTGTYLYPGQTTPTTCPCVIRTSFADEYHNGNKIPSSRIDPVAAATQAYWPKPNRSGSLNSNGLVQNNYTYTAPQSSPFIRYFGRLDYQIKSNNRLSISESEGDNPGQGFGAGICPINCQSQDVSKQLSDLRRLGLHSARHQRSKIGLYQSAQLLLTFVGGPGLSWQDWVEVCQGRHISDIQLCLRYLQQHVVASIQCGLQRACL